jgi:hypothetical protein
MESLFWDAPKERLLELKEVVDRAMDNARRSA